MQRVLPAFLILLLAACAQPTTQLPTYSAAELRTEQQTQKDYAGTASASAESKSFSKAETEKLTKRVENITGKVRPSATTLCHELHGQKYNLCNMDVVVQAKSNTINAYADGQKIYIEPQMIDFAKSDTHLAMVLAHEYAHHMMKHVASTQQNVMGGALLGSLGDMILASQGVNTQGAFGKLGAQGALLSYSPSFEQEADYIAMYILARSGYNIDEAPQFWREMTRNNPDAIYTRTTHPTGPERYVVLNKTIAEIKQKQQTGQPLLPNFKPQS
jgi:predicted Zn-dependent protease